MQHPKRTMQNSPSPLTREVIVAMMQEQEKQVILEHHAVFQLNMLSMIEKFKTEQRAVGEVQPPAVVREVNPSADHVITINAEEPRPFPQFRPMYLYYPPVERRQSIPIEEPTQCCFEEPKQSFLCIAIVLAAIYILSAFLITCIGLAYAHNDCSMVYFGWCLSVFILRGCLYCKGMAYISPHGVGAIELTIGIVLLAFSITTIALSHQALHSGCDMSRDGSGPLLVVGSVMYALVDLGLALFFIIDAFVGLFPQVSIMPE